MTMKKETKKKTCMIVLILCVIAVITYLIYPLGQYIMHNMEEGDKISENFYLEVPYTYNVNNHFCVFCENNGNNLDLIVDTKAICMMKNSDIEKNEGVYFSKLPIITRNSLGQKIRPELYYFPNFKIDTFSTTPLFASVKKDNYLYHIIDDGVLGINMLKTCTWKFSVDDTNVKLFRNNDSLRLKEESRNFIRIADGLLDKGIKMNFSNTEIETDFTLDLGQSGEIIVNNEIASELKKYYNHKKIHTLRYDDTQDSIYLFDDVSVEWKGVKILHCQVGSRPSFYFNQNYIGAKLMHRFNFILSFVFDDYSDEDLYIQPCMNFDSIEYEPFLSDWGLNIDRRGDCLKVVNIEDNGIADRSGIKLGDEILQVDSCTFTSKNIKKEFIQYAKDKKELKLQLKDKNILLSRIKSD